MVRVGVLWMAMVLMITSQAVSARGVPSYRTGSGRTRFARILLNSDWGSDGERESSERVSEPGAPPSSGDWNNSESGEQQGNSSTSQGDQPGQKGKSTSGNGETSGNTHNDKENQQEQEQEQQQGSNGSQQIPGTIPYPGYEFLERAFGQAGIRIVPRSGAGVGSGQPCKPTYYGQKLPGVQAVCLESPKTPSTQAKQGR